MGVTENSRQTRAGSQRRALRRRPASGNSARMWHTDGGIRRRLTLLFASRAALERFEQASEFAAIDYKTCLTLP